METGRKIMNLRLDLGITQREMASKCRISPGSLSKIETGANHPSSAALRTIAKVLGTSADYLLDETAPYPPPRPPARARGAGNDPLQKVRAEITREESWLLEDLRSCGAYWREAAFALAAADVETIRLVRFLLQRGQFEGAREAEVKAREAAGTASSTSARKGRPSPGRSKKQRGR